MQITNFFIPEATQAQKNTADSGVKKYSVTDGEEYSYQTLISKEDMLITMVDDTIQYTPNKATREAILNDAISNAISIGRINEKGNAVVFVPDLSKEVILSKAGFRHGLDRRLSVNAPATLKAGEILKNAIKINELHPKKQNIDNSYVLVGIAKNSKDEPYIVQFVVNEITNEVASVDVLYSVNAKIQSVAAYKTNRPGAYPQSSQSQPATLTDSKISISDLLHLVNRYFPDVLSKNVYKHFGHANRPSGSLGQSAKFSIPEVTEDSFNRMLS